MTCSTLSMWMREVVLPDEGWKKVYLQPDKEVPKPPRAFNKRYILKMVFLAAAVRPRKLSTGVWFDRKISIWPIVDVVTAQCPSKSRARGVPVLRPVTVDGEKYKKIMINEVIPAIKTKMHRPPGHSIFLLQDGAKPHTKKGVTEAIQAEAGSSIILETQLFNSPSLNMIGLRLFHPIQQLKEEVGVTLPEGLVEGTLEAFNVYPREMLACVWHSCFAVYGEILGSQRYNRYEIPHSARMGPEGGWASQPRIKRLFRPIIVLGRLSGGPQGGRT
ncbi:unnamed protein product [Discosporangium mesarthrocarpum]